MPNKSDLGMLLLHALPLDGSMWARQMNLLPGATYAPDLYDFGDDLESWAQRALQLCKQNRLIVVGCSVGGSCALEIAATWPERVVALVLIGTKAGHNHDPELLASTARTIEDEGLDNAWQKVWAPHFSNSVDQHTLVEAKDMALRQSHEKVLRGLTAFHGRQSRDEFVAQCPVPIHVVTGEDDTLPGPRKSADLAALAPLGSFHMVPSCGHYVPIERPHDLNSILTDVIATQM